MFNNYLKIAFRNMKRHKIFSTVNIIGLLIGITSFMLIMIWIGYEMSFDSFNKNKDRIYRLCVDLEAGSHMIYPMTMPNAAPFLKSEFPEVQQAARLDNPKRATVKVGEDTFIEEGVCHGDNSIFDVFTFPFVNGNPQSALTEPYTAVLSESISKKYFGDNDPIGEIIEINSAPYRITGIIQDIPMTAHFHFNIMGSFSTLYALDKSAMQNWFHIQFFTYILLGKNTDVEQFENKFPKFIDTHLGELLNSAGASLQFFLQPLKKIHLHSELAGDIAPQSDIKSLYIFASIALFILIIAGINFINLSTANSSARAKEIGLRKTIGSNKKQLIEQFLVESILMCFFAMILSLVLVDLFRPNFFRLFGTKIDLQYLSPISIIAFVLLFPIFIGVLAGSYPAFYLSRFKPVTTQGSGFGGVSRKTHLRNFLVICQFTISIVLIISTLTIFNQISFMRRSDPGFEKENVIVIPNMRLLMQNGSPEALKQELLTIPGIEELGFSSLVPGFGIQKAIMYPEGFPLDKPHMGQKLFIDDDYLDVLGVNFVDGRKFSQKFSSDPTESVIINQTAAKTFGWSEPLGKTFLFKTVDGNTISMNVVGVIKDFHSDSFHNPIEPLIIYNLSDRVNFLAINVSDKNVSATIEKLKEKIKIFAPDFSFKYYMLDEIMSNSYNTDFQVGKLTMYLCILAVLLGCLGLFGLTVFLVQKRTKEIGIRKVLGASVSRINIQLSREFVRLIFISIVMSFPIAFIIMKKWLENFAYKTSQNIWIFVISGLVVLLISIITVCFQTIRASQKNPAEVIKYE